MQFLILMFQSCGWFEITVPNLSYEAEGAVRSEARYVVAKVVKIYLLFKEVAVTSYGLGKLIFTNS